MAMVVQHNIQAQLALGELNKNVSKVGKLLGKVSSGQKIVSAQDDSSAYVISEKMREQIRTLLQDNQNVQNGLALFKTAEGGINSIVEELRNLKELAINSANDTNTDVDRLTIQKEFTQKMANINDIATTTNYNGKTLLDGTYRRSQIQTKTTGSSDAIMIYDDGYNIDSDGVYILAKNFTGTVNVNAQNVKIMQEDSSTVLENVSIIGRNEGNQNLWIEDLNITNNEDKNVIKFQGANNVLTVKGDNFLNIMEPNGSSFISATVNIGGGLTVSGIGNSHLNIINFNEVLYNHIYNGIPFTTASADYGSGIGTDSLENSNADVIIGAMVNISVRTQQGAGIGGAGGYGYYGGGTMGNIIIGNNATVNAESYSGAGIGSGIKYNSVGNIYIADGAKVVSRGLSGIGSGYEGNVGNIYISNSADVDAQHNGNTGAGGYTGADIGAGIYGTAGTINYVDSLDIPVNTGVEEPTNETTTSTETIEGFENPLKIHHGTKANQATNFFINDMHTKSLGTSDLLDGYGMPLSESDLARYDALSYDDDLQAAWLETLKLAQNKTLDDISVTTKQKANVAIRVLDGALEYALNEATQIGSYLQRLDYTDVNVTTMSENVQASESTIRDADMAKEMTEYTKWNVLTQSAQAMLAQANQNGSAVLSLLQ